MNEIPETPLSQMKLLVAMPQLVDPHFHQAVVWLLKHNEEGAMGLVINKKGKACLQDIRNLGIAMDPALDKEPIWFGGPCEPAKFLCLRKGVKTSDMELCGDSKRLSEIFGEVVQHGQFKVFSGYSGWIAGQLEKEIKASVWLATPMDESLFFDTPHEKIWEKAIRSLGVDPSQLSSESSSVIQ